jgi:hypothetical protein
MENINENNVRKNIRITEIQRRLIGNTSPDDCWLCDHLFSSIRKDKKGYFIPSHAISDDGVFEHLNQLIDITLLNGKIRERRIDG